MNPNPKNSVWIPAAFAWAIAFSVSAVHGQTFYTVGKEQKFLQTSTAGAVADPIAPFHFSVQAATNVTFTNPAGSAVALTFFASDGDYELDQDFASKAALDTAYAAGTFRMTGAGIPTLNFNLATEAYPTATPQITGGTWNAGGLLVVNPTQGTTINFSTFTGFTSGAVGHMELRVQGYSDGSNIVNTQVLSQTALGITGTSTPPTSIVIPAGSMTNGRVYQGSIKFDTGTLFDTTTISGGAVVTLFSKTLNFYIAAVTSGDGGAAATITTQPTNQTGVAGGAVTFTLNGNFSQTTNIQWFFNGQSSQSINPDGTKYQFNNGSLTVRNLTTADVGNYYATIVNTGGIVTSNTAALTLVPATAPTIAQQPAAKTVGTGSTAVFNVGATGVPTPFTYQWKKDGVNLVNGTNGVTGATGATLVIQSTSAASAGNYTVTVTNSAGTATSNTAALTVTPTTDPGRLINLSILTPLNAGESMTLGTVLGGAGTSGSKPLLVRAVGPSLQPFGIASFLPNPSLTLNSTSVTPAVVVATNTKWGGSSILSNVFASVGAFGFTSTTSNDSAIYQSNLQPGNYTVQVSDASGAGGTVIAELYDATAAGSFTSSTPRLINVAVLKGIASGSSLTAGFVIGGSTAKSVLIRAIGPGLAAVGLTSGTMADPQLTLNSTSVSPAVVVATNNDWGADNAIAGTGNRVGAFSIGNNATKDAMLLVTLAPGQYTAQVNPVSGTAGGTAIVEVYEVP